MYCLEEVEHNYEVMVMVKVRTEDDEAYKLVVSGKMAVFDMETVVDTHSFDSNHAHMKRKKISLMNFSNFYLPLYLLPIQFSK